MTDSTARAYPPASARVAWIFFDWAAQPFFTLVTTFVFAPFFAAYLAPDPARGQALWGYATGLAGLTIALLSPALGSIADASGRRKPWIFFFSVFLVVGCAMLWWAAPGRPSAVAVALTGFVLATIGAEFATVFNNAMLPSLAPPQRIGRLSGTGWAAGYVGGLISLAITLGFLAASPETGKTLLGHVPLFGLDAASHEGDRAAGPLSALWYMVFVLPLFLLTPDSPRKLPPGQAVRAGLSNLRQTVADLPSQPNLARFLIANMIATDGLVALFAFGGIYAAGVFGWGTIEIGLFGILLTITGTIGAFVGGRLDERLGPKTIIIAALIVLALTAVAILSIGRDHLFFMVSVAPKAADAGLFSTGAERLYIVLGLIIGAVAGPLQSASRTMLARMAPPGQAAQFFGLFALSGKVTSFMGPMLVAIATDMTQSQKAGMAVLVLFFVAAAFILSGVRLPPQPAGR